jgi:asparagine synthase (glutamine-hydrolysing)
MCGIWSLVNVHHKNLDISQLFQDFYSLKHRGPDSSYFETYGNVYTGFHRLAIIDDTFSSNQPFLFEDERHTLVFLCNGEIYNYKELSEKYGLGVTNDCMVLPAFYHKFADDGKFKEFIKTEVKGEFAFTLFVFSGKRLKKVLVGRDEIGIRPLYYSTDEVLAFSSEIKGLGGLKDVLEFPPGHIFTYFFDDWYSVEKYDFRGVYRVEGVVKTDEEYLASVKDSVVNSVKRRLSADKPIGFLLSGGVDSSLVAAISAKLLGRQIRTFCCGMNEGTDLKYARMVAEHIGSEHTEVFFTEAEGLEAIRDVIYTIESWDTTTVRASVGQYLVSKYIGLNTDCKVLMVGEGPDEVCSSYLFNWYCPNGEALSRVAKEYVDNIHYYDVKRSDRCISGWGLEARVALLDPEFIRAYWEIPGELRMPVAKGMEKWWLREAFAGSGMLPDEVLWRKKEAFSDGVSGAKSWFQIIQEWVSTLVTDEELERAREVYPYCTPMTKEAYYYRKLFVEFFGEERQCVIPGYWQPKWDSQGREVSDYVDPSARMLSVYGV